ncbi:MAG: gliding motility-associated C-terminal domain-containing protein [Cytophagales bacterium]|nr:MAG: gliding motility-associated C-terminal domain-containing protein [Cytophagales bacterium]
MSNIKIHRFISLIISLVLLLMYSKDNCAWGQSSFSNIKISGCLILGYCINVESTLETKVQLVIDLNSETGFQANTEDVAIDFTLKKGANCIPWDGYTGKRVKITDGVKVKLILTSNNESINHEQILYLICPPIANDDKDSTVQNQKLVATRPKLGINDQYTLDLENNIIYDIKESVSTKQGGSISIASNGTFTYAPPKNFIGIDFFSYKICYTKYPTVCDSADVQVKVLTSGFEPPKALDDFYKTKTNKELTANLTDNDVGAKLCKVGTQNTSSNIGGKYTVSINGTFTYTPPENFVGLDSFGYEICNAIVPSLCDSAWVYIQVVFQKDIVIPSGFSPNNDGLNDFFEIANIEQYENEVKIFNRWGSLVYEAKNYDNNNIKWEAKSSSGAITKGDISEGTYYYIVNLKDSNMSYKGYVVIIK